jgi:hypothetical protein
VFAYSSKISKDLSEYGASGKGMVVGDQEDAAPYIFRSYDHWGITPAFPAERNPGPANCVAIWVSIPSRFFDKHIPSLYSEIIFPLSTWDVDYQVLMRPKSELALVASSSWNPLVAKGLIP